MLSLMQRAKTTMHTKWRTIWFATLTALAGAVMTVLNIRSGQGPLFHTQFPQCFDSNSAELAPFLRLLPEKIANIACITYSSIRQLNRTPGASLLAAQLVRLGVTFVPLALYEGARQIKVVPALQANAVAARRSWWHKLNAAPIILAISNITTGAVALPFWFAMLSKRYESDDAAVSTRHKAIMLRFPPTEHVWATLLGLVFAYILPVRNGAALGWPNSAIDVSLAYPLLVMFASWVLPPFLQPFVATSPYLGASRVGISFIPLSILAGIAIVIGTVGHIELLTTKLPYRAIFGTAGQPVGLIRDLHAICIADYIIASAAIGSWILAYFPYQSSAEAFGRVGQWLGMTAVLGPGAATAIMWVQREYSCARQLGAALDRQNIERERDPLISR